MRTLHRTIARVLASVLLGCGPSVGTVADGTATGSSGGGSTTAPIAETTTGPGPSDTTGSGSTEVDPSLGFIMGSDMPPLCGPIPEGTSAHCDCDVFDDGWCVDGYKCMPWANDGGEIWNATRCAPVTRRPATVGEPCTNMGSPTSGYDDCDQGSVCLFHDDAGVGRCVARCQGSQAEPLCDAGTECFIGFDGVIALCLPSCDPLAPDCELGQCIPDQDDGFVCFPSLPPPAEVGQPCDLDSQCPALAVCTGPGPQSWCNADCTCRSLCDLQGLPPEASCGPGQTCLPWFQAGQEPAGLESVGFCGG